MFLLVKMRQTLSPPQRFDGVGYVYPLNEVSAGIFTPALTFLSGASAEERAENPHKCP